MFKLISGCGGHHDYDYDYDHDLIRVFVDNNDYPSFGVMKKKLLLNLGYGSLMYENYTPKIHRLCYQIYNNISCPVASMNIGFKIRETLGDNVLRLCFLLIFMYSDFAKSDNDFIKNYPNELLSW